MTFHCNVLSCARKFITTLTLDIKSFAVLVVFCLTLCVLFHIYHGVVIVFHSPWYRPCSVVG